MLALLEGNTKQAENLLSKSAARSDAPALTYIGAARAAHQNGDFAKRDKYLDFANKAPGCKLAVGLVSIELQLDAEQFDEAYVTLKELNTNFPKNKQICQYYLTIYPGLEEWQKLITLINTQRKQLDISEQDFFELELHAHQQLFQQLASEKGELLADYWNKNVSRAMRKELSYQKAILSAYIDYGRGKLAQTFLMDNLQHNFSLPLLSYLPKMQVTDHYPLIALLEKKLKRSEFSGYIHQALGHLQLKENHPEAAASHFIESVKTLPNVADYQLLASLLEEQGKGSDANSYYRQGLEHAVKPSALVELS